MAGRRLYYTRGNPDLLKILVLQRLNPGNEPDLEIVEGSPATSYPPSVKQGGLVLELPNGDYISSIHSIYHHMWGTDNKEKRSEDDSLISTWLEWEIKELQPAISTTVAQGQLSVEIEECFQKLEQTLTSDGINLVGDDISLADVVVWGCLCVILCEKERLLGEVSTKFSNVHKWFIRLSQIDAFLKAKEEDLQRKDVAAKPMSSAKSTADRKWAESSEEELKVVKESWQKGQKGHSRAQTTHPVLPIAGERNVLVTSALPYVNNVPHLGNIIGCVLSGDVFARYCRLRGYNTLYVCGTDEYGTATETKALEEGITEQEVCSKYFAIHSEVYKWFNIDFDVFGRTSTTEQTKICQDIFWQLHKNGYISRNIVEQLLCQSCDRFLADRFVEGECPFCSYEDARGDQCDKCGKLINAVELKAPRCKLCSSTPIIKTSNHLFLDLNKLEPEVKKWFLESSTKGEWPNNATTITSTWLRDGIKPRCISRDLRWGTPVPLEGYTEKVFYVWFDAPIGYLSITAVYTDQWEKWWKNPEEVQLYQFMAKDNVPFHSVVFPCSLIGSRSGYTLVHHLSSTEYLNYEDGKFSKSRGVGVFGTDAKDTGIPADTFRFYLLFVRPETQDSVFSWADFAMKNNSELLNNLGNFIYRTLVFIQNNFDSIVPDMLMTEEDYHVVAQVSRELTAYIACLEKVKMRDGVKHILSISRAGNGYIQSQQPWKLIKGSLHDVDRARTQMGLCANIVCLLAVLLNPYMPVTSKNVLQQLMAPDDVMAIEDQFIPKLPSGHKIGEPKPLFEKIEDKTVEALKDKFSGKQKK